MQEKKTGNTAADVRICTPNAKRWRSSLGRGGHRGDEKMCALITSTPSARDEQLNNSVLFILCVGIVSWRFTNKNNVASFSHGCQHRFSKRKEKVLKLKLLPLVLEKAWLSVRSSWFACKLVHRYKTLSIIEIQNLRPSPAGSTAKRRSVGRRGTMTGRCSPETGVLPPRDRCPSFAMSSLSSTSFVPNGQLVMVPT